ncbi:MAG: hypothetical protein IIA14_07520 [SAR324 cluster bacterium]|nr:hypothetical protein [SAR324 cluster bacterium]
MASAAETGANGDAVEERMGAILKLADRRGHRPETALTHYAYAEVLQRRGDTSRAHEHLHAATTRFAEMGMRGGCHGPATCRREAWSPDLP